MSFGDTILESAMPSDRTRVLVIGGTSFIGQHVVARLAARDDLDVSYTYCSEQLDIDHPIQSYHLDVTDLSEIRIVLSDAQPQVVILFSAATRGPALQSVTEGGLRNVLAALPSLPRAPLLIYPSTDLVHGNTCAKGHGPPYNHKCTPQPMNDYGRSKLTCEGMIKDSGCRYVITRSPFVYGNPCYQMKKVTGFHNQLLQAMKARETFTLFTDEYRQPIYVHDYATAYTNAVVRYRDQDQVSEIFNLCGGDRMNRMAYGHLLCTLLGIDKEEAESLLKPITLAAAGQLDVKPYDTELDMTHTCRELGFELTPVQVALDKTFAESGDLPK